MNTTPFSLVGKTILITGASSGIGRSTAIECSKMGARLVISGRNEKRLCETFRALEGDGHSYIMADLSDGSQLDELVEQSPTLDGLVNNAGITETLPTQFIKQEKLIHVLEVNTIAPIMLTQKLLKAKKIGFSQSEILDALNAEREIAVFGKGGERRNDLIYCLRCDGENRWLFIAHCDDMTRMDGNDCAYDELRITVKGRNIYMKMVIQ